MKTEYRLKKYRTMTGDLYLQFKDSKGIWRFIPDNSLGWVMARMGYHLYQRNCPKHLTEFSCPDYTYYMHSFFGQEQYTLIPFTKSWPDIEKYFEACRLRRQERITEETKVKDKYKDDTIPL